MNIFDIVGNLIGGGIDECPFLIASFHMSEQCLYDGVNSLWYTFTLVLRSLSLYFHNGSIFYYAYVIPEKIKL